MFATFCRLLQLFLQSFANVCRLFANCCTRFLHQIFGSDLWRFGDFLDVFVGRFLRGFGEVFGRYFQHVCKVFIRFYRAFVRFLYCFISFLYGFIWLLYGFINFLCGFIWLYKVAIRFYTVFIWF